MPFGESPVAVTSGCQAGDVSSEAPPSGPLTAGKRTACRGTHADLTLRPPPVGTPTLAPVGTPTSTRTPVGTPTSTWPFDLALATSRWDAHLDVVWTTSFGHPPCAVCAPFGHPPRGRWMEGGGWRAVDGTPTSSMGASNTHPTRAVVIDIQPDSLSGLTGPTGLAHWPDTHHDSRSGHPSRPCSPPSRS